MPTQLTITTELTRQGLLTVRDEIDALLAGDAGRAATSGPTSPAEPPHFGDLDALAIQFKSHLGEKPKRLVRFLVEHYDGIKFTWEEVAAAMGEDVRSVKSWHRSFSKPLKRIAAANPSAPRILPGDWDGSRNHYVLSSAWAGAIARTW